MENIKTINYDPRLRVCVGSINAVLLVAYFEKCFEKQGKLFNKFLEPCNHQDYVEGESLTEVFGMTSTEFRTAFKHIGVVYKSKKAYNLAQDKFQGKMYLSYYDRISKLTYYMRNDECVSRKLREAKIEEGQEGEDLQLGGPLAYAETQYSSGLNQEDRPQCTSAQAMYIQQARNDEMQDGIIDYMTNIKINHKTNNKTNYKSNDQTKIKTNHKTYTETKTNQSANLDMESEESEEKNFSLADQSDEDIRWASSQEKTDRIGGQLEGEAYACGEQWTSEEGNTRVGRQSEGDKYACGEEWTRKEQNTQMGEQSKGDTYAYGEEWTGEEENATIGGKFGGEIYIQDGEWTRNEENIIMGELPQKEEYAYDERGAREGESSKMGRKPKGETYANGEEQVREKRNVTMGGQPEEGEYVVKEDGSNAKSVPFEKIRQLFNSICQSHNQIIEWTSSQKKKLGQLWTKYGQEIEAFKTAFEKIEISDFLSGRVKKWKAQLDWLLKPEHFAAILTDKYRNFRVQRKEEAKVQGEDGEAPDRWDFDEIERLERERIDRILEKQRMKGI